MLSIFPELLPFSLLGVTIVRITIGFVLLNIGLQTLGTKRKEYSIEMKERDYPLSKQLPLIYGLIQTIVGVLLVFGILTQVMAILSSYLFMNVMLVEKHIKGVLKYPNIFYVAMILISLSLLFLGPGAFAVDLPV